LSLRKGINIILVKITNKKYFYWGKLLLKMHVEKWYNNEEVKCLVFKKIIKEEDK